ncbi:lytic murein transglycosylase B [Candidatus Litorirhabdus singularis]|uniref:lytic murein transglycosylase B n=1 Tax=Candidatus Litorirhabdus singularis TaxID=2518993 RepID=UPI00242F17F5|nr:lytic murein transglycosylase B [Candidatus Litorirhabdus singularis]
MYKLFLSVMLAGLGTASAWADGYADNTLTLQMIDELVAEEGFERDALLEVFGQAERKDSILKAIARPAEKTKPWHEYRQIFVTSKRTAKGLDFYQRHRATLERAEAEFGVPAEMITAVIGVETRYGENMGSFRVIDALSTLAFDYPPRSSFFSKELKHYLILTREQSMPAAEMLGSYAGAMGYGQFMPSSYRAYAVDFDGDDVIDIWNNPVDAIGSVANYFKRHGWRSGETVTMAATVSQNYQPELANDGLKPKLTVADFAAAGYTPAGAVPADAMATAMEFEGSEGLEHWLGLHNFYVITRYNHSAMYAMSVYQLSQELAHAQSAL